MNKWWLADEAATVKLGHCFGRLLTPGVVIFLHGQLGAGKTTLTRGLLQGMGHSGAVKSPTYTLVEPYEQLRHSVSHFDLYRLADPEELEYMGIRDYFDSTTVCVVEWPERGRGILPSPDLVLELQPKQRDDGIIGRQLTCAAQTPAGNMLLALLTSTDFII